MDEILQTRLINWGQWLHHSDNSMISAMTGQIKVNTLHRLMVNGSGKRYSYASGNTGSVDHSDAKLFDRSLRKVNSLTPQLRNVLSVYYASGLSIRDLSKLTKISKSTFQRKLKKAEQLVENNI